MSQMSQTLFKASVKASTKARVSNRASNRAQSAALPPTLVVIEPALKDSQPPIASREDVTVLLLDPLEDAIAQITYALHRCPASEVHLICRSSPACLHFSTTELNFKTLDRYAWDLQSWFLPSLATPALLLYDCNIAQGEHGSLFVDRLQQLTGATVTMALRK